MPDLEQTGNKLNSLLAVRGLTQMELSRIADISIPTLWRALKGEKVSLRTARKLIKQFSKDGLRIEDFGYGEADKRVRD